MGFLTRIFISSTLPSVSATVTTSSTSITTSDSETSPFYNIGKKIYEFMWGEDPIKTNDHYAKQNEANEFMGGSFDGVFKRFPHLKRETNSTLDTETPITGFFSSGNTGAMAQAFLSISDEANLTNIVRVPGDVTFGQAGINARRIADLIPTVPVKIFNGSPTTFLNKNTTEITEQILKTNLWGSDGLGGLNIWDDVDVNIDSEEIADKIIQQLKNKERIVLFIASPLSSPCNLIIKIQAAEERDGVPPGTYLRNIQAAFIAAGCFDPKSCDADTANPNQLALSERRIAFDVTAASLFFGTVQDPLLGLEFPTFLLTIDELNGLDWGPDRVEALKKYKTPLAKKMAAFSAIPPTIGPYRVADAVLALALAEIELFGVECGNLTVGNVGQLHFSKTDLGNVCLLKPTALVKEKFNDLFISVIGSYAPPPSKKVNLKLVAILLPTSVVITGAIVGTVIYLCKKRKPEETALLAEGLIN